jgi:hypothetical protein
MAAPVVTDGLVDGGIERAMIAQGLTAAAEAAHVLAGSRSTSGGWVGSRFGDDNNIGGLVAASVSAEGKVGSQIKGSFDGANTNADTLAMGTGDR